MIVKKQVFFISILLLGLLEVTILEFLKIFNVKPNLLLISAVVLSLSLEFKLAFALSVFAGLLKDVFSLNAFGINILLFPLWSFLILKLSKKVSLENDIIRIVLIFIVVISNDIIIKLIFSSLGRFIPLGVFLRTTFLEALYTAAALSFISRYLRPLSIL